MRTIHVLLLAFLFCTLASANQEPALESIITPGDTPTINTTGPASHIPISVTVNSSYTIPGTGSGFCMGNLSYSYYTNGSCTGGGGGGAGGSGSFTFTASGSYSVNLSFLQGNMFLNSIQAIKIGVCSASNGVSYQTSCIPMTCSSSSSCSWSVSSTPTLVISN